MLNLKELSIEELNDLLKDVKEEIASRNNKKIIYCCDVKGNSEYSLKKYKSWAKLITNIDTTKTNGYAFVGNFLNVRTENLVNAGDYVVELVQDQNYFLYKATGDNNKELLLEGKRNNLITFIRECKKIIEQ